MIRVVAVLAGLLGLLLTGAARSQTVHLYDGGSAHVLKAGSVCVIAYGESPYDPDALFLHGSDGRVTFVAPARQIRMGGLPVRLRFYDIRGRGAFEVEAETVAGEGGVAWYEAQVNGRFFMLASDTLEVDGVVTVEAIERNRDRPLEVLSFGAILSSASEGRARFDRCREGLR